MRTTPAGLLALLSLSFSFSLVACGGAAPDATFGGEDLSSRTVLRIHYPENGHAITVRGSTGSLNWNRGAETSTSDGLTETLTVTKVSGTLQFKPLIDDETWSLGPNYAVKAGASIDVYPRFYTTQGTVTRIDNWWSTDLQNDRPVYVYTPPSYAEQTSLSFPVVYMHDGQNLFDAYADDSFVGITWSADGAMDDGAADGSIREAIVVGIGNTDNRIWEYTPNDDTEDGYNGGGASTYLDFVAQELKPQIDANYRTLTGRADTVMIGSSLGGLVTGCASLWQPATFGNVGLMSPSTWWTNDWITAQVTASASSSGKPLRVYVDSGDAGDSNDDVTETAALYKAYKAAGYPSTDYLVGHGDTHTESSWARRLPGALQYLLGPRAALP